MNLLPAGFYDVLSPDAQRENDATQTLLREFAQHGYGRVNPPLMEFEETLLSGPGAALTRTTFRAMDPASQRMLACRSDHTLQIGRIASTRLSAAPRPLRLSYAGPIVRLSGAEQNPARQMMQVGAELIGSLEPTADAEAVMLAVGALTKLGITDVSIDVTLPTLIPSLCEALALDTATRSELHHALERKDEALVQSLAKGKAGKVASLALDLLRGSGKAAQAIAVLDKLDLPEKAALDRTRLKRTIALLPPALVDAITVDLVEYRGFEYQTGLSFALFSRSARAELGRGGRYRTASNEPATGFTFYAESLMPVLPASSAARSILVPFSINPADAEKLAKEGYVILRALDNAPLPAEAKRLGCNAFWENGNILPA